MTDPSPATPIEDGNDFVVPEYFENLSQVKVEMMEPREEPIPKEQKTALELENRKRLESDLLEGRLQFSSRPRVVEIQLTNFCNMSCTMCYDGDNPPLQKLPEALVDSLAEQLFPWASVFVPFATSEPLILTWDHTRRLAELYNIELEITTNVQFLDEAKFAELEPHAGVIEFSIDSHMPDIYESIRLRSNPKKVFRNLPIAAKLCREHGIEVLANVVFMTKNAPYLDETVRYLAESGIPTIHIQKLFYNKEESYFEDAALHFSKEWIEDMKQRCIRIAKEKQVRVAFDWDSRDEHDFLPEETGFRENRTRDHWLETFRRALPGYCPQSVYRFKVDADGNAYPCCVGVNDRLLLGNIYQQSLDEIWNGPSQQDLRRAMLTEDVPQVCEQCNFRTGPIPGEIRQYPFNDAHFLELEQHPEQHCFELDGPEHLERCTEAPEFTWTEPECEIDRFEIVLSFAGEGVDHVIPAPKDARSVRCPDEVWGALRPNFAYWWTVYGIVDGERRLESCRARRVRAFRRHEALERVPGSTLIYSDQASEGDSGPELHSNDFPSALEHL
jgi:radical SAM protein with 4Fe4S-binding SPASM domain